MIWRNIPADEIRRGVFGGAARAAPNEKKKERSDG